MDLDKIDFRFHFSESPDEEGSSSDVSLLKSEEQKSFPSRDTRSAELPSNTGKKFAGEVYVEEKEASQHVELVRIGHLIVKKCIAVDNTQADTFDLVPGIYEGGRKLWECSLDLGKFMTQSQETLSHLKGARVLELGCGHGLLGICALLLGAASVDFQDYNKDVLYNITSTNVASNLQATDRRSVRYFCGDWKALVPVLASGAKYNIILSAETIYSPENQAKLCAAIESCLCPKNGFALLGAKSYYFGVGGGTRQFEALVSMRGKLDSEVVKVFDCGTANKREILKVQVKAL